MPTYKNVEVWLEDSEDRKLNHQQVSIDLADSNDRMVNFTTEMHRDEFYSVHCLSPMSLFCDVYVTAASRVRQCAARFCLDKSLAISGKALGSSIGHTVGNFKVHGLRTPKRQFQHGKLGNVEVEIRRIGEITKGEPRECYEPDGGDGVVMDFVMIDDPDQPPWLVFWFDMCVKEPPARCALSGERGRKRSSHAMLRDQDLAVGGSQSGGSEVEGLSKESSSRSSKKRHVQHNAHDGSLIIEPNSNVQLDFLQLEYQKEQAEERRLVQKLQEQLRAKKERNMELRQLLGEAT